MPMGGLLKARTVSQAAFGLQRLARVGWAHGLAAGLLALQGCAHVWVDSDGTRHVVGLVRLSMPPQSLAPTAGESFRSRSVGLSFSASEAGSAFVIGYSDTTFAFVRDHSLVFADALLRPGSVPYCRKD